MAFTWSARGLYQNKQATSARCAACPESGPPGPWDPVPDSPVEGNKQRKKFSDVYIMNALK